MENTPNKRHGRLVTSQPKWTQLTIPCLFFQIFQLECCILKRGEEHPNIQNCLGVINRVEEDILPFLVFKDVAVGSLQAFISEDERATNTTKLELVSSIQTNHISTSPNSSCRCGTSQMAWHSVCSFSTRY